jgi:hypothetical protein
VITFGLQTAEGMRLGAEGPLGSASPTSSRTRATPAALLTISEAPATG